MKEPTQQQLNEWFEQKASETSWSQGQRLYGGRPREMMEHVINILHMYEKMMEFLVQAGYTPDRIQFLTPMSKMKGNNEEKREMRKVISDFVSRLMKGEFPESENYTYFRSQETMAFQNAKNFQHFRYILHSARINEPKSCFSLLNNAELFFLICMCRRSHTPWHMHRKKLNAEDWLGKRRWRQILTPM